MVCLELSLVTSLIPRGGLYPIMKLRYLIVAMSAGLAGLLLFGATKGRSTNSDQPYKHLAVFSEVISRIKSDYVEEPDLKGVTAGAVNGLLEAVDPYASYLSADQFKEYSKKKDQDKGDVGLVLSRRVGYVSVISPIHGSPSASVNLSPGDLIEAINGVATRDMPLAYAEMLLRGEPGTSVEITILRIRNADPQKISLKREVLKLPDVTARMTENQIGLITARALEANHVTAIGAKARELEAQGAKKLILDLRGCAAGAQENGIALANVFLDKGLIVYLQGQKQARKDFAAEAYKQASKLPLIVLTNRGTAGAAEIAATGLLENKRAEVVGDRTYGNAGVRRTVTLDDGSALILSVAKYYSASAKAIQDNGVVPTHPVADTADAGDTDDDDSPATPATPPAAAKSNEDAPLKKAIELLSKQG